MRSSLPSGIATLCIDGRFVGTIQIATTLRGRARGLPGVAGAHRAVLLSPGRVAHTFDMRASMDVAYLDRDLTVLVVRTMRPSRVGRPRLRARWILETEAGILDEWGLGRGSVLLISGLPAPWRKDPPQRT